VALLSRSAPPAQVHGLTALQRAELANDASAATWVAQQVSRSAVIACDPQMCTALVRDGFPAAGTRPLTSTAPIPTTSTLVIETATVRALFGTSLASDYAPSVLTTIGSGPAQVTIRVIAPGRTTRYERELASDQANQQAIGRALLGSNQVKATPAASAQMAAGRVDTRLLLAITFLAAKLPVDIVSFGNDAFGATAGLPLRYVDLAEDVPAAHMTVSAYVSSMVAILKSSADPYPPLRIGKQTADGVAVVRVGYSAPTPLGLGGPAG
jgi:hypothetical protein